MHTAGGMGYVCMAVYRPDKQLLEAQIRTLASQTEAHWTCLVGIDGSDERARQLVEESTRGDDRFVVTEYPENVGFYRNFERLLRDVPSDATWVALADQDDVWFPEKLRAMLPLLKRSSLVVGQVLVARPEEDGIPSQRRHVSLLGEFLDNQVTGSACVFRRDLLDIALPFPPATDLAFHDHWLGVCASVQDGFVVLDEPLQRYIQHDNNVVGEERRNSLASRLRRTIEASGGAILGSLYYLRDARWGWRVNMARQLAANTNALRDDDRQIVDLIARASLSTRLLRRVIQAVSRRYAPPARSAALMIGASISR